VSDIEQKIERSSLGTRDARAARRTVTPAAAAKIVTMAAEMATRITPKKVGGNPISRTYTSGVRPIQPGTAP
jgi:hypothetical protein